jgi:hypothetical protein
MEHVAHRVKVADLAACTTMAAHTRDHRHTFRLECCHPHAVEVIFLGRRALTVCHDCRADSGFLPYRQAEHLAEGHRDQTRCRPHPAAEAWPPGSAGTIGASATDRARAGSQLRTALPRRDG